MTSKRTAQHRKIIDCHAKHTLATLDACHKDELKVYDRLIIPNADFSFRNLEGACFIGTVANYADFTKADLYWAHIDSSNFSYASFCDADLRTGIINDTIFHCADFRGCNFSFDNLGGNTIIRGCDLTGIVYDKKTNFNGLLYDENCLFPIGFSQEQHGMRKEPNNTEKSPRIIERNKVFATDKLYQLNFHESVIANSHFENLAIEHCTMSFADFSHSSFKNSTIENTQMNHSFFHKADFRGCVLCGGCNLSSAYMGNILFDEKTLFDEIIVNERTMIPKGLNVKNYMVDKIDTDLEGHWQYIIPTECYSFSPDTIT